MAKSFNVDVDPAAADNNNGGRDDNDDVYTTWKSQITKMNSKEMGFKNAIRKTVLNFKKCVLAGNAQNTP